MRLIIDTPCLTNHASEPPVKTAQLMPNRAEFLISAAARMTPSDGEAVLRGTGWLSTVEPEFQSALLRTCRWKYFEAGETLVRAGNNSAPFIGIASGSAAITTALGAADTPLTHIAHAGIWTGFVAFIGNRPTDNETVALTRDYAAVISRSAVEALLIEHPTWWRDVALATIANLSRNTTNALLGELERMGMVARHYNYIDILDPIALRAVADGEMTIGGRL